NFPPNCYRVKPAAEITKAARQSSRLSCFGSAFRVCTRQQCLYRTANHSNSSAEGASFVSPARPGSPRTGLCPWGGERGERIVQIIESRRDGVNNTGRSRGLQAPETGNKRDWPLGPDILRHPHSLP